MRSLSAAGGVLSYFARHRTAANLLLVLLIAAGVAAVPRMRAQFFPDVVIESIGVTVAWPGAGAEDVDAAIVQVLGPALQAVDGVESTDASSSEGRASIEVDFEPGWDMARAAEDVQAALDAATTLPEGAEDPEVRRAAWWDRVTDVVITGPVGPEQLGRYADELSLRLFAAGVTRTSIRGFAAPEILVEVTSADLLRHDVTMEAIARAVGEEAAADPAGDVSGGASRVRTGVPKRTAEEVAGVVLRTEADGSALTVGDVGPRPAARPRPGARLLRGRRPRRIHARGPLRGGRRHRHPGARGGGRRRRGGRAARGRADRPHPHPGGGHHGPHRHPARQRGDGAPARGGAVVPVPQRAHGVLGGRGHPRGAVGGHRADVGGGADEST